MFDVAISNVWGFTYQAVKKWVRTIKLNLMKYLFYFAYVVLGMVILFNSQCLLLTLGLTALVMAANIAGFRWQVNHRNGHFPPAGSKTTTGAVLQHS